MTEKKFLITGGNGQLAREFISHFKKENLSFCAPQEQDLDITNREQIERVVETEHPDILINCAAYNQVDLAEEKRDLAFLINADSVNLLADVCRINEILFVHFSSDYVFDGRKGSPYQEEDKPNPLNVYGFSKLKGEEMIKKKLKEFLILRLSWVFGDGQMNFLHKLSEWAQKNDQLKITSDEISVPTYTEDVVSVTLAALENGLTGIYHLVNSSHCSRYEWAKYFFAKRGEKKEIVPVLMKDFPLKAKRPAFSAMSNAKISKVLGMEIPTWENGVDRYLEKYSMR